MKSKDIAGAFFGIIILLTFISWIVKFLAVPFIIIGFLAIVAVIGSYFYDKKQDEPEFEKKSLIIGGIIATVILLIGLYGYGNKMADEKEKVASSESYVVEQTDESTTESLKEDKVVDIRKLTQTPSSDQQRELDILADQAFAQKYRYKGSKLHSIIGVVQPWTAVDGETWYKKLDATIVNAYGAERTNNIEIHIEPTGEASGIVTFVDYGL